MLELGSLVDGKYKILNKVGQGGMSVVYLAMNEKANKQWAVKEVRKDGIKDSEIVQQGLIAETNILKKLKHSHLPSIIDVIESDDTFVIIMDYIQGNCLKDVLAEFGAQPQEYVVEWAKQLCNVLGYLHSRDPAIIYRDMKPANIMWNPDEIVNKDMPSAGKVTLIDFGTAREYKGRDVADTWTLGTTGYAAPEQYERGQTTDARTDIYNLGATMYHLVTGESPYKMKPIREVNPSLSTGLERIIWKCTQQEPSDRYQSAAELMYDLEHYQEDDEAYKKKQRKKLTKFLAMAGLSVAFGITSASGFFMAEKQKSEDYDQILLDADSVEDYYEAILTDTSRTEAYLQFDAYLAENYVVSREEWEAVQKLQAGLDQTGNGGYIKTIPVLDELKNADPAGYEEVCFRIGWSLLSYYDTDIDRERYANAAKWFRHMQNNGTENGEIAAIFCDISECTTKINELHGSKVIQTQALKEHRESLWRMVQNLKAKADNYDTDYQIQVWIEINALVNSNIRDFLEVEEPSALIELLREIQNGTVAIDNSNLDIQELVNQLQVSTAETIRRVETAQ